MSDALEFAMWIFSGFVAIGAGIGFAVFLILGFIKLAEFLFGKWSDAPIR